MQIVGKIIDINHDCIVGSKNGELVIPAGTKLEITDVSANASGIVLAVKIKKES